MRMCVECYMLFCFLFLLCFAFRKFGDPVRCTLTRLRFCVLFDLSKWPKVVSGYFDLTQYLLNTQHFIKLEGCFFGGD